MKHQWDSGDWAFRKDAILVSVAAAKLTSRFNLGLSQIHFSVDKLRFRGVVRFRSGTNAVGLRGEIQVNSRHLKLDTVNGKPCLSWRAWAELTLALIQAWQQEHGTPPEKGKDYFNAELRR